MKTSASQRSRRDIALLLGGAMVLGLGVVACAAAPERGAVVPSTAADGDTSRGADDADVSLSGDDGHPVRFEYFTVDADPPSGDGCCLDALSTGDVDGDGDADLVLGAENADGISWYRNPADGSASSVWTRFVIGDGDFTTDLEAIDLDADGDLDVVASAIDRNVIEWWEQVGDPTTSGGWVRHLVGPDFAHDLMVADVDGDGDRDVVAYHKDAQRLDWFEQGPDVAVEPWVHHVIDELPGEGLAIADLDADGDSDLVAGPAVYTNDSGDGSTWTRVLLADDWAAEARAAVADVDGDGILDIVLSTPESDGRLSWFRGPTWEESVIDLDAGYTHSLEIDDVDLDGRADVFTGVMHFAGTHEVRVLFGDGGSSWVPQVIADTGTHNAKLTDLDGDDRLDIVGKNFDGPKEVEIWWNRPADEGPGGDSDGAAGGTPLDGFDYVHADDDREGFSESVAFFGLAFGDLDGDGRDDIASGRYVYSNPGGDLSATWERTDLGDAVGEVLDAMLVTDVDGDSRADVIATSLPDVWWLEAGDVAGTWSGAVIATVPATSRPNGQGYRLGDITGDGRDEIVLCGGESESEIWYVQIPEDPREGSWPTVRITDTATDEQIGIGDINGDGFADVSAGDMHDGGAYIAWFENPGDGSDDWTRHRLGEFPGVFPDRMELVDLDGDGGLDVVVTEENDGAEPNAEVMWYEQPEDPYSSDWERHVVVTQYTTNALDAADLDGDGDIDLTTGEHRGTKKVAVWENVGTENDGALQWVEHPVDEGRESHLGARVWDLDGDGDMEIVSIGFDERSDLHLWVND